MYPSDSSVSSMIHYSAGFIPAPPEGEGIPAPDDSEGIIPSAEAVPASAEGVPSSAEGVPFSAEGISSSAEGFPSSAEGIQSSTEVIENYSSFQSLNNFYFKTKSVSRRRFPPTWYSSSKV